jgi:hypothetical protein
VGGGGGGGGEMGSDGGGDGGGGGASLDFRISLNTLYASNLLINLVPDPCAVNIRVCNVAYVVVKEEVVAVAVTVMVWW